MSRTDGGPAFPAELPNGDRYSGMTLLEYAEIHFTAAWIQALGGKVFEEAQASGRPEDTAEFIGVVTRLGRAQADSMLNNSSSPGDDR
jgi:hypothetical protein